MKNDPAGQFIEAVENIKKFYSKKYNQKFTGFGSAWQHALDKNDPVARRNQDLGVAIRELRNAISHTKYKNGVPIAEPRADLVEAAEKLSEAVQNPAKIDRFMNKSPININPDSTLPEIAGIISQNDFSQIPICVDGRVENLLTTNAISRWLAKSIELSGEIYEDTSTVTANDLLQHSEGSDTPKYVKPNCPAYKVCDMLSSDIQVPAVLVTVTGDQKSELKGIVTVADVPKILKKLGINGS